MTRPTPVFSRLSSDDDIALARAASEQIARALSARTKPRPSQKPIRLLAPGGPEDPIVIPAEVMRLLADALAQLGAGHAVAVLPRDTELTTQEVADYLNVSRSHVLRLIQDNRLPARKVGTARRVAFEDLLRFDDADRLRRRAALDRLAQLDQEMGL